MLPRTALLVVMVVLLLGLSVAYASTLPDYGLITGTITINSTPTPAPTPP